MGEIDLDAPDPLYQQLAAVLRQRIQDGTYARRLPSGPQLAQEFDLARPTVAKALGLLKTEGLIKSVPGRGTFIVEKTDED